MTSTARLSHSRLPTARRGLWLRSFLDDDAEHLATIARLRRVLVLAVFLWFGVGVPLDAFAAAAYDDVDFRELAAVRLGALLLLIPACLVLFASRPPRPRLLRVVDVVVFGVAGIAGSALCVLNRGVDSPYTASLVCILVVRGVTLPEPWWRGSIFLGVAAISYPLTFLVAAALSPHLAAVLSSRTGLATFIQNVTLVATGWILLTVGGHAYWAIRRQLYESRDIGRYRLRALIGVGAMGEVWRAWHRTLRRDVAVKIMLPGLDDAEATARFDREAWTLSQLHHPNTVRIFDFGMTEDGIWYYVMELLDGETLAARLERTGPLAPADVIELGVQLAGAIAEAHDRGIVHRDLKPGNVFLEAGATLSIKVLDFGLAHLVRVRPDETITRSGTTVGTPAFMAPEQALNKPVDARTDIYSTGATLYAAVAGRPPFLADSDAAYLRAQVDEPPSPASRWHPVPRPLEDVIMHCLAKHPAERFQTGRELAAALVALRSDRTVPP